jgi:hypothetical protein
MHTTTGSYGGSVRTVPVSATSIAPLAGYLAMISFSQPSHRSILAKPRQEFAASDEDIAEITRWIDDADSVVIMCGGGCRGAADQLRALSDRLKAPLIHSVNLGPDIVRALLEGRQPIELTPKNRSTRFRARQRYGLKLIASFRLLLGGIFAQAPCWRTSVLIQSAS